VGKYGRIGKIRHNSSHTSGVIDMDVRQYNIADILCTQTSLLKPRAAPAGRCGSGSIIAFLSPSNR
jgi:hypothetical protein